MAESGTGSSIGFGNTRYPYYYGPEGRLVLDEHPEKGILKQKEKQGGE